MPPKAGLDKAAVVQSAARLVNAEGIESLSLHRLARELKVQTPSLYNHIDGLPGLTRELALLNTVRLGDSLQAAAVGVAGPQAVRALAHAYRSYIHANPGLYAMSLRASRNLGAPDPELSAAEDRVVRVGLKAIASFNLSETDAIHAVRGLRSVVHGFAMLELAGGFGLPLDCDESFRRLLEIFIQGLTPAGSMHSQPAEGS
jgi:AcrR family transcriptional regulator